MTRRAAVLMTATGFAFVAAAVTALAGAWWAVGFVGVVLTVLGLLVDVPDELDDEGEADQ